MDFSSSDEEEMARLEEQLRTPKTNPPTPSTAKTFAKPVSNFFNEGMARLRAESKQPTPSNFSRLSSRTIVPSSTPSSPPEPNHAPSSSIRGSIIQSRYNPGRSPTSPRSPIKSAYIDPAILFANSIPTRDTTSTTDPIVAQLRAQLAAATTASAEKDDRLTAKDAVIASLRESKTKSKARQKRRIEQLREEIAEWDVDRLGIEELEFRRNFERDEMQAEIWRLETALADVSTAAQTITAEPDHSSPGAIMLRCASKAVRVLLTILLGIVLAIFVACLIRFVMRGGGRTSSPKEAVEGWSDSKVKLPSFAEIFEGIEGVEPWVYESMGASEEE